MSGVFCFMPCKPRYCRVVDSIYQRTDKLIANKIHKLIRYASTRPEKLGSIGEYLLSRLLKDINRKKFIQVQTTVEAMDQLLQTCYDSPSLPQLIDNHRKMIQNLLESGNYRMEQLATNSLPTVPNIPQIRHHRRNSAISLSLPSIRPKSNETILSARNFKNCPNTSIDFEEEDLKEKENTKSVLNNIRSRSFEDRCEDAGNDISELTSTLDKLLVRNTEIVQMSNVGRDPRPKNIFEIEFPSLVY